MHAFRSCIRCAGKTATMLALVQATVACDDGATLPPAAAACEITAPRELLSHEVLQIQLGMPLSALSRLLGKPAYSPVRGQHYFLTGGLCPVSPGADLLSRCGVIAEYRRFDYGGLPKDTVTDALQSCQWGAISE